MCLFPKQNWFQKLFNPKPRIKVAKEDIKVYKVLRREYNPYAKRVALSSWFHKEFIWEPYKLNKETLIVEKSHWRFVWSRTRKIKHRNKIWIVNHGLHSYTSMDIISQLYPSMLWIRPEVYNAIIPKGSHYIIGDAHDIVSDQLIITDDKCEQK